MAEEPKSPPTAFNLVFVGSNREEVERLTFKIDQTIPAKEYEDQNWAEAAACDEFCAAVRVPDDERLRAAMRAFDRLQCWTAVWVRLSRVPNIDDNFRQSFRSRVAEYGFRFRESVRDCTGMIGAFRHLLPPYVGLSQQLYRGELAIPRSRHNPKILWVDDAEIVGDRIT